MKNPCYTKSKPLQYEEFESLQKWWNKREENEYAWKVPVEEVKKNNYNLDLINPNKAKTEEHRTSEEIVASIAEKEKRIFDIIGKIQMQINEGGRNAE